MFQSGYKVQVFFYNIQQDNDSNTGGFDAKCKYGGNKQMSNGDDIKNDSTLNFTVLTLA